MHKKTYLEMMIMKVFTTHINQNLMITMMSIKKTQQNNNIDTKPPNVFSYLKSLSQKTKDLTNEIGDVNDGIGDGKLLFIGSNKEKFNFNIVKKPLNFISAIYNGEISPKEAKFFQKNLEKNRRPKI